MTVLLIPRATPDIPETPRQPSAAHGRPAGLPGTVCPLIRIALRLRGRAAGAGRPTAGRPLEPGIRWCGHPRQLAPPRCGGTTPRAPGYWPPEWRTLVPEQPTGDLAVCAVSKGILLLGVRASPSRSSDRSGSLSLRTPAGPIVVAHYKSGRPNPQVVPEWRRNRGGLSVDR